MHGTDIITALERMEGQSGHKSYFLNPLELTRDYCKDLNVLRTFVCYNLGTVQAHRQVSTILRLLAYLWIQTVHVPSGKDTSSVPLYNATY